MSFGERPPSYREPQPGPPQWNGAPPTGTPFGAPASWETPKKRDLPMPLVAVITVCVGACAVFGLVSGWLTEREQAARAAAARQRAAEEARSASARASAFAPRRAEFESMAATARGQHDAQRFAALADLVRPFDTGLAEQLQTEAALLRIAEACGGAASEAQCTVVAAALAANTSAPSETLSFVRSTCGPPIAAAFRSRIANLAGVMAMREDELNAARPIAACIQELNGYAQPSVFDIDAATRRVRERIFERPAFQYTGGGGYGGRGGGRCRDSRGRFTRCY